MKHIPSILLTGILCLASTTHAYQTPESAVFDAQTDSYYVSNFRGNSISKVDATGTISDFATGLSQPLGLVISDQTLYAIDSPRWVKGFDLKTGEQTFVVEIPEAQFLNDITTCHHGTLYATDSRAGFVYRIDIKSGQFEKLFETAIPGVNGIYFDATCGRLVACTFKNPGKVIEVNPESGDVKILWEEGILNLDGIAVDSNGNFYISTWGPGGFNVGGFGEKAGKIYCFKPDFLEAPTVAYDGLEGPADISIRIDDNTLLLPEFLSNIFTVLPMSEKEAQ